MKKNFFCTLTALIYTCSLFFSSCEGPAGSPGKDGKDGKDANSGCTDCHNSTTLLSSRTAQYMNSQHAFGETVYESRTTCAACHTHEGFREVLVSGKSATAQAIENPSVVGCKTCHGVHETYTSSDWTLKGSNLVTMLADSSYALDYGSANTCINCHQSRPISPDFKTGIELDSMTITNGRWGPHHAPQSAIMAGILGYGFGSEVPVSEAHKQVENGCIACHMSPAVGVSAGGHTFKVKYELEGEESFNMTGCNISGCHSSSPDIEGFQAAISASLDTIQAELIARGLLVESTGNWNASSSKSLKVHKDLAGAMFNYKLVAEDRSLGIHNPAYTKELLDRTMNYLETSK